jgi:hypothetical protein
MPHAYACRTVLVVTVVSVLAGCGSTSSTVATQPQTTRAATATTTATTPVPATGASSQGLSYSSVVTVPANPGDHFTFQLSLNVTLGAASTNTKGDSPPDVNVVAPISGTATITNTTAGYTANAREIPTTSLYALYRSSDVLCPESGGTITSPKGQPHLCAVWIVALASGCSGNGIDIESLAAGQTGTLALWGSGSSASPAAVEGGPGQVCSNPNLRPSETVKLRENATAAPEVIKELAAPPIGWAVVNDYLALLSCPTSNDVISSKPAGVTGCLGAP